MLHGILRAATVALILTIAVLVYINYFRSADPDLSGLCTELSTAPELPKIAAAPEAPPAPAPTRLPPIIETMSSPIAQTLRPSVNRTETAVNGTVQRRTDASSDNVLAEVVELPPANNPHAATGDQLRAAQAVAVQNVPVAKRTHIVQPGESLWVISKKMYGNAELYGKIADANGMSSKDRVRVGQVLVIPDPNATTQAVTARAMYSEDTADHEDTPRSTQVSLPREAPAVMSSTTRREQ